MPKHGVLEATGEQRVAYPVVMKVFVARGEDTVLFVKLETLVNLTLGKVG